MDCPHKASELPSKATDAVVGGPEEASLVEYDPYDWRIHEDPYPTYARLRAEAPVYYNEGLDFYALSRHADVLAGFRNPVDFSNANGVSLEQDVKAARDVMSFLGMDPPEHTRVRTLVSSGFTPRRVRALEPRIREIATHYLDAVVERGECEFIEDFAGKLPMDVISEMLGVPEEARDQLRGWADTVLHREEGNPNVPPAGMEAAANMLGYFSQHVSQRRRQPGDDDLTDALISAEIEGDRLEDRDIIAFLFLMIIAGNETTTKLLANALYWLAKNPDQRKKVDEDPALIAGWAEETLRYDPSSQLIARSLTRDVEVEGVVMPAGARVALLIGSGNRDERAFDAPDTYDVERSTRASLSFGQGTHFCLGASMARLEAQVSLEEVQLRLRNWRVREDGLVRMHSSNVRGFSSFPISFDPA